MIERITILGGSSVYTPEFILSAISHNVNIKEIVLIGRDGQKLPVVARFCQRLVNKSGFPTVIQHTTNLAEGVRGANYILNAIRVGGMQARLRDEKMPVKCGIIGDETLGAGGFSNALRTVPVVLEMAKQIERVAPEATFINLTNPTGIVVEALTRYSRLNVIGVCDLPGICVKEIAEVMRCSPADLWVDYIGLNHFGWIQDVKFEGRSCMASLLERLERSREDGFDHELIELFHMIPTRTVGLFFHKAEVLKRQQACVQFRAEALHEAEQQILRLYHDEHLCEIPPLARERNAIWYEETIIPLIQALESRSNHDFVLCQRNRDCIRDLPEDASVEVPVQVSKKGLKPHVAGSCPRFLRGLFMSVKESDRLAIEAARHRSYEYALQSLIVNPLVPSLQAAKKYLDMVMREENIELH